MHGGEERVAAASLADAGEVGLGYLRLGQPLNTLSRWRSAAAQAGRAPAGAAERDRRCFILDEPTTGLHFDDIALLL